MSAQQVVSIAEQQLGISGRPNKFTQWYGAIGGTTSYAWCVVFIGWCFSQAGLSLFPRTASVVCVLDYAKENGYFKAVRRRKSCGDCNRRGKQLFLHHRGKLQ